MHCNAALCLIYQRLLKVTLNLFVTRYWKVFYWRNCFRFFYGCEDKKFCVRLLLSVITQLLFLFQILTFFDSFPSFSQVWDTRWQLAETPDDSLLRHQRTACWDTRWQVAETPEDSWLIHQMTACWDIRWQLAEFSLPACDHSTAWRAEASVIGLIEIIEIINLVFPKNFF